MPQDFSVSQCPKIREKTGTSTNSTFLTGKVNFCINGSCAPQRENAMRFEDPRFYHQTISPKLLIYGLKPFRISLCIDGFGDILGQGFRDIFGQGFEKSASALPMILRQPFFQK
jgi:hypothetical protein